MNSRWGRLGEEPTGLNSLAQTSLSSFPPPLTSHQIWKQIPAYHLSLKRHSSIIHPLEEGTRWGDVFFFPGHSENGKSVSWKQHEWLSSHFEGEKNQDPEKPSHLSWDSNRARLEPSLSSSRPMPFPLHCAVFHQLIDNQNWKQKSSFFLREPQAHCIWCPSMGEHSPKSLMNWLLTLRADNGKSFPISPP